MVLGMILAYRLRIHDSKCCCQFWRLECKTSKMIPHKIIRWHKSLPPLVPVRYADWLRRTPAHPYASAVKVVARGKMINAIAIKSTNTSSTFTVLESREFILFLLIEIGQRMSLVRTLLSILQLYGYRMECKVIINFCCQCCTFDKVPIQTYL